MKPVACILLFIFASTAQTVFSQEYETKDLLIIKSPSDHFNEIVLQTHNNLPRLGVFNHYNTEGQLATSNKVTRSKQQQIHADFESYKKLIALKYAKDLYKNLNTEKPTVMQQAKGKDIVELHNTILQQLIRSLLNSYFCKSEVCLNAYNGANEFEILRNYKAFSKDVLPDLLAWSKTIFEEESNVVYFVSRHRTNNYNFDKKGYETYLSFNLFDNRQKGIHLRSDFKPKSTFEKAIFKTLANSKSLPFFIPMSERDAEALEAGYNTMYLVRKMELEITYNPLEKSKEMQVSFNHANPTIEIYKDAALLKKIGEISLEKINN